MSFDGRISIRLTNDGAKWLADRTKRMGATSPHQQAKTELEKWQNILAAELRRIRLTLAEACCIADILSGTTLDCTLIPSGAGIVYAECADAFYLARDSALPGETSYAARWGIDEQALLSRLAGLGPAADHALRDAMSRWWAGDHDPTVEGFAKVGLRVVDTSEKN